MPIPEVTLANAEAVTAHYASAKANRPLMWLFRNTVARYIKVDTHYQRGAKTMIRDEIAEGRYFLIARNYQEHHDPLVIGSMMRRERVFRPMRLNTVITARSDMFRTSSSNGVVKPAEGPDAKLDTVLHRLKSLDDAGLIMMVRHSGAAVPMFLDREYPEADDSQRQVASDALVTIIRTRMDKGENCVIYPEGSHLESQERDRSRLVLPLQASIGEIACGLRTPEDAAVLCIGTVYGADNRDYRHPTSFVTQPFRIGNSPQEVVEMTTERLQFALNVAVDMARASSESR